MTAFDDLLPEPPDFDEHESAPEPETLPEAPAAPVDEAPAFHREFIELCTRHGFEDVAYAVRSVDGECGSFARAGIASTETEDNTISNMERVAIMSLMLEQARLGVVRALTLNE